MYVCVCVVLSVWERDYKAEADTHIVPHTHTPVSVAARLP